MSRVRMLAVGLISVACSSCATLDESQCRAGNWRQLGYVDGLKGYANARIAEHQDACKEYGIAPDRGAWQAGYAEGQLQYCTVPNGYIVGRSNQVYGDVCPPKLDARFRPAYENGRRIASLLSQLDGIDNDLGNITSRLEEDDRRSQVYLDAIRSGHKPEQRPELLSRDERRQLERDYSDLNNDYANVRRELERRDADYSADYGVQPLEPAERG